MLEQAMQPGATPDHPSKLDDQFYKVREDLAVMAARYIDLTPGAVPSGPVHES